MMTEPQLNCCLYFIIQHRVTSSKMLLQFEKEMKIQKCQVTATSIWWAVQKSETNMQQSLQLFLLLFAIEHYHAEGTLA